MFDSCCGRDFVLRDMKRYSSNLPTHILYIRSSTIYYTLHSLGAVASSDVRGGDSGVLRWRRARDAVRNESTLSPPFFSGGRTMTEFLRVIASRAIFAGYLPSFDGTLLGTLLSARFFILHD